MTKAVQKWADKAMYSAAPIDATKGPQVQLLSCNNDPLGTIAAAALMYEGKHVGNLAEITDDQRRYYLDQVQRSVLEAPLEFVNFHFHISGVTRGFTHQMVRQRTATYTQESTRFAVKEVVPVGLPPSLEGTVSWEEWWDKCGGELFPVLISQLNASQKQLINKHAEEQASKEQIWRREWDWTVDKISLQYNALVDAGMPAEDARGLLPTNLLTRINYNTSMRGLKEHAGVRLCTQAQFEWRVVWTHMLEAIREYGKDQMYRKPGSPVVTALHGSEVASSQWQFDALASVFKPICYYKGKCQFMSDVDRHCTIRDRVNGFASLGIPSSMWNETVLDTKQSEWLNDSGKADAWGAIPPIRDEEWMLDPTSARISQ